MLPITACLIGKNEENNIERCIQSLLPYGFDIQYTDTGSQDGTLGILSRYPVHISHFPWCEDFSAARNHCISHASNDWILSIDCDESIRRIDQESLGNFIALSPDCLGRAEMLSHHSRGGEKFQSRELISRLFHRKYYAFEGRVHEQLAPLNLPGTKTAPVPIFLEHFGYDANADILTAKAHRNIRLLMLELAKVNTDPYIYYQLGQSYFMIEDYTSAIRYFTQGLSFDVNPKDDFVINMVNSYGYSLIYTKNYVKAMEFVGIYDAFCSHADFVFLMGLIYMYNCLFDLAIAEFQKATKTTAYSTDGVNSYLACYNIGVIYECLKDIPSAVNFYEKCGSYKPAVERLSRLNG